MNRVHIREFANFFSAPTMSLIQSRVLIGLAVTKALAYDEGEQYLMPWMMAPNDSSPCDLSNRPGIREKDDRR